MALPNIFEEPGALLEEAGAPGLAVGIGAVILAPILIPVVAGIGKPLFKGIVKGGIALFEKTKGAFAEVGEAFEDVVAEAKAELAENQQTASATASRQSESAVD